MLIGMKLWIKVCSVVAGKKKAEHSISLLLQLSLNGNFLKV